MNIVLFKLLDCKQQILNMANLIKGNIVGRILGVMEFGQSKMVGTRQGFRRETTKINL